MVMNFQLHSGCYFGSLIRVIWFLQFNMLGTGRCNQKFRATFTLSPVLFNNKVLKKHMQENKHLVHNLKT